MKKSHPIRPHLAAWRAHFKQKKNWLANKIGTSHTTVRRHELGELGVDDATFAAIAEAYGITVAELSAPPADAEKARALHRVFQSVQKLGAEDLRALAVIAERMEKK